MFSLTKLVGVKTWTVRHRDKLSNSKVLKLMADSVLVHRQKQESQETCFGVEGDFKQAKIECLSKYSDGV
jgi:hypothetical protein